MHWLSNVRIRGYIGWNPNTYKIRLQFLFVDSITKYAHDTEAGGPQFHRQLDMKLSPSREVHVHPQGQAFRDIYRT